MKAEVSRRNFLAGMAGVGALAAAGLAGCAPQVASDEEKSAPTAQASDNVEWNKETDVVVVGFGGAGAAAAIEAKRAGSEVVLLEMNPRGGGSTMACGGFIMMGGTELQEKFGVEDSTENFYKYLCAAGGETEEGEEFIRVVADASPEVYKWCVSCGMDFESGICDMEHHLGGNNAGTSLGFSGNEMARDYAAVTPAVPRGHMAQPGSSGKDIFAALQATVEAEGIEVLYETPGSYLLQNAEGRVTGICAQGEDGELFVKARKGVVLTCGGFVDNPEMLNAYYPFVNKRGSHLTTAGSENGSGILMGQALGAATRGMGRFQIGYPLVTLTEHLAKGVLVNERGHRIVAEDEYNSFMGKAIIMAPTSRCYTIVDEATLQEGGGKIPSMSQEVLVADSFAEIAEGLGINADVLEATMAFYNESVSLGEDREFGKAAKFLHPMETGPFHVYLTGSEQCYTASCGGLKIDTGAHVLKEDGTTIPGLYAAGRNAGTIYGWYMGSGSSLADVFTFGRIAGQNAAAEEPVA